MEGAQKRRWRIESVVTTKLKRTTVEIFYRQCYLLNINRALPEASYQAERYSVKTKHIHILSESDHEMIVKRAAELNMTVGEYTTAGRYQTLLLRNQ